MRIRRKDDGKLKTAAVASLAIHVTVVLLAFLAERMPDERPPRMRVYAVNIVSPPPNLLGDPPAEPPAPSPEPAPASGDPAPTPPDPQPAPPPPPPPAPAPAAAPKEPEKAPAPTREPERPRPETPRADRPVNRDREAAAEKEKETPRRTEPNRTTNRPSTASTEKDRPRTTTEKEKENRGGTTSGRGTSSNSPARSTGTGTRGQATGRNPDRNSPGGEGLTLQSAGMECPSAGYCENIVRQVRRYFRRPEGEAGSAEACFRILSDGTVDRITVRRVRGGAVFRLAVSEAVEQAGLRGAFGPLPDEFGAETLPVCVDITPQI